MTAKRADIEEAVNKELRAVLDGVGKQSKRGGTSAKEHLKAIAAFRLIVMEAKPWHREAWPGYCDQAAWMKAAAKVMKYLHEVFTLPSEEKPVR